MLEPVAWSGERHGREIRTKGPGRSTSALGLVFGPWRPEPGKPRIEIYVGRHHVSGLDDPHTRFILWNQTRRPLGTPRLPASGEVSDVEDVMVDIAGGPIEFTILKRDAAWIAQGWWRDHAVQLEADHIPPDRLQLETTRCA